MTQSKNIDCAWVEERIDPYLDGDLGSSELTVLADHLGGCTRCRQEVDVAARVAGELRELPEVRCPDAVVDVVVKRACTTQAADDGFGARLARLFAREPRRVAFAGGLAVIVVAMAILAVRVNRTVDHFSSQEIEQAEAALRWTFAYVNDVSRKSGYAVRDQVFAGGVMEPVQRALHSALQEDEDKQQEEKENGESI